MINKIVIACSILQIVILKCGFPWGYLKKIISKDNSTQKYIANQPGENNAK